MTIFTNNNKADKLSCNKLQLVCQHFVFDLLFVCNLKNECHERGVPLQKVIPCFTFFTRATRNIHGSQLLPVNLRQELLNAVWGNFKILDWSQNVINGIWVSMTRLRITVKDIWSQGAYLGNNVEYHKSMYTNAV